MANKYLRKYLTPTATTETTIYTVPAANVAILSSLRVTNTSASATNLTVVVYPLGGVTPYYILKTYVLPPNATMDVISGVSMVLQETDVLKVTSSQADSDFYLSYLEVDRS
jgi:hypothetical protein